MSRRVIIMLVVMILLIGGVGALVAVFTKQTKPRPTINNTAVTDTEKYPAPVSPKLATTDPAGISNKNIAVKGYVIFSKASNKYYLYDPADKPAIVILLDFSYSNLKPAPYATTVIGDSSPDINLLRPKGTHVIRGIMQARTSGLVLLVRSVQ